MKPHELHLRLPRPVRSVGCGAAAHAGAERAREAALHQKARTALEQEQEQLRQALAAVQQAGEEFHRRQEEFLRQAEGQLVELAMRIARKVLAQEIQAGRYEIEPIVRDAMQQVSARHETIVHLHPEDFARCSSLDDPARTGQVKFVSDAAVERAQCLLETAEGVVESSVETRLEDVAEALRHSE